MDEEAALRALTEWLNAAHELVRLNDGDAEYLGYSDHLRYLIEGEDQVSRIVGRIEGDGGFVALVQRHGNYFSISGGLQRVAFARGRLQTRAATSALLGSEAPVMSADGLHSIVWGAASKLWDSGHYSQAVQRAATLLNAEVQERVDRHDVSDVRLMNEVFSSAPPSEGKARLRWPGSDDDLTVVSLRDGIRAYAAGCYQAIRNPTTHSSHDLDRQVALEQLAALSVLMRWIDQCDTLRPPT